MDRRWFLKFGGATLATGATAGASFGIVNTILNKLPKQNPAVPEANKFLDNEALKNLKDRNTIIEIEKRILNSFGESDIELLVRDGRMPFDKIHQLTKDYHNAIAAAFGTAAVTASVLGATGLLMKKQANERKAPEIKDRPSTAENAIRKVVNPKNLTRAAVGASFLSALVAGFAANNIIRNHPSLEHIQSAEENVRKWLTTTRSNEKFYASRDAVMHAISTHTNDLTMEQIDNTSKLSLNKAK